MGQFSWITADTNEQVFNDYDKDTYYLLVPPCLQKELGCEYFVEEDYEGYGVFGGKDAYALVAQANCPDQCKNPDGSWQSDDEMRMLGIDIACYDKDNCALDFPIKITAKPCKYNEVGYSKGDPNQGWHNEYDW